jgi:predicted exporter
MLLCGAIGVWAFRGLPIRSDIHAFVPESEERELAEIARQVTDSEIARTQMLSLGPYAEPTEAAAAARAMGALLAVRDDLAWVRTGPPVGTEDAFYSLYFPRRFAFAANDVEAARASLSDEALATRARDLRSELTGPMAMLMRRIAPEDPLLLFPQLFRAFQGEQEATSQARFGVVEGTFVATEDAHHYGIVMLASRGSTFSATVQEPILAAIHEAFTSLHTPEGVRLEQAGVARFAVRTERVLRNDTQRISIVSTVGIVVLFLLLFRGPRFLVLGFVPLVIGSVLSVAACRLFFGGIHAITLAFGSSLLGVGIDFIAHYVNHHVLDGEGKTPEHSMRTIQGGLVLGAFTTVLGLAGLGFTSFPGMREIGVFAAVGVFGSLLVTMWMVPPWMPEGEMKPTRAHLALLRAQTRLFTWVRAHNKPFVGAALLALIVAVAGLSQLSFIDDLRRMNEVDPALTAEDNRVRTRIAQGEAGRFVIAIGEDEESALEANDRAFAVLQRAQAEGELTNFRSIFPLLRAASTQREVDAVYRDAALAPRVFSALESEGFVAPLFAPFDAALHAEAPAPLTYEALAASPLGPIVEPFRVALPDDRIAYLTFVSGVHDPAALGARLNDTEGVHFFDQARYLESAYRTFRERAVGLVLLGLLLVFGACIVRYRNLRLGFASIAPALLASLTSLGLVGLFFHEANLMHLVACLLVLSMGEDYAVFLVEARDSEHGAETSMVGIFIACITTVLSFGLLALSSHPALRAIGFIVAVGDTLAYVFAPLALVIAGRSASAHDSRK